MPKAKESSPAPTEPDPDVAIEFNGAAFTIPRAADEWPTVAWLARIEASASGRTTDWLKFVELLLGPQQWKRLTESSQAGDFKAFLDLFTATVLKECAL